MKTALICVLMFTSGVFGGMSYQAYRINELLQPVGYEMVQKVKKDCEAKWGVTCGLYGGMTPQVQVQSAEIGKAL